MRESWLLAGCVCDGVCQCYSELLLEGWAWVVVTRCRWCKSRCLVELCYVTWFIWLPWLCVGARTGVWFLSSWCGGLVRESVWWWLIYRGVLVCRVLGVPCRYAASCLSDVYFTAFAGILDRMAVTLWHYPCRLTWYRWTWMAAFSCLLVLGLGSLAFLRVCRTWMRTWLAADMSCLDAWVLVR